MTMIRSAASAVLSLAIGAAVCSATAAAQDAEKAFYTGKTVRMIVGSGVGGGYDVFSRLIAPYLAKTLGATVIVDNVPGRRRARRAQQALHRAARRAADFARRTAPWPPSRN